MNSVNWLMVVGVGACVLGVFSLFERIIIPWRVKRSVDRIIADVKAGRIPKREDYEDEVSFDNDGFNWRSLKKPKTVPVQIAWADVRRVVVFKIDLFAYDEIRLCFLKSENQGFEISEQAKGWSELTEALPRVLPGCKRLEDWIWTVASPAFARNETQIYSRDDVPCSPELRGTP